MGHEVSRIGLAVMAFCIILLSGCSSLQEDILLDSAGETQFRELDMLEENLVDLRLRIRENGGRIDSLIAKDLDRARRQADELASESSLNRQYVSRLEALRGLEAWLSGEYRRASRHLESALDAWELDEISMVLEARLLEEAPERLAFIDARLQAGEDQFRLEAERGAVLFELGNFGSAVASWDAALPGLPGCYTSLFEEDREKAWVLRDTGEGMDSGSVAILSEGPVSLGNMVEVTLTETPLLDGIDNGRNAEGKRLFVLLLSKGWLVAGSSEGQDARRRDAALFLWNLLARRLGDADMLHRYSDRFAGGRSPVPDLNPDDPWFDGALGCVQTEIMSLPDGKSFRPDDPATGLELIGWLAAVNGY